MTQHPQKPWYRDNLPLLGGVIVDVGANVGELSQLFFERAGPKGRVVSVEPHPDNIKRLERRIRKAGSRRWSLKRCAISSRQGMVSLRELAMSGGANAMVVEGGGDFTVACMPLAALVPDATVVKLDVEGHEYAILPEAVPALTRARAWAVELHKVEGHPLEQTLALFAAHGFTLVSAGTPRDDPRRWLSVDISPSLTWSEVPGQPTGRDERREFKMLHLIARR